MNALVYALAGCLLILAAPTATADHFPIHFGDELPRLPPYCVWFSYTIDPVDYDLRPECLIPPGP